MNTGIRKRVDSTGKLDNHYPWRKAKSPEGPCQDNGSPPYPLCCDGVGRIP